jgi:hypothetical protein
LELRKLTYRKQFSIKYPQKVELYLSPSFCNYHYLGVAIGGGGKWRGDFLLGDSVCSNAPNFFKKSFEEVFISDEKNTLSKDVKIIISPEIISAETIGDTMETNITIKWSFVSPGGKVYYLNTISGIGRSDAIGLWSLPKSRDLSVKSFKLTNYPTDNIYAIFRDNHDTSLL